VSLRNFFSEARAAALAAGLRLPQSKLNDAVARALFGKPYSAVIAASNSGTPPALPNLPPPFIEQTAKRYKVSQAKLLAVITSSLSRVPSSTPKIPDAPKLSRESRAWLKDIAKELRDGDRFVFDPAEMIAEVQGYEHVAAVDNAQVPACPPGWEDAENGYWLFDEGIASTWRDAIEDVETYVRDEWYDRLVEYLQSRSKTKFATDQEYEQLDAFIKAPSATLADSHRVLRKISDVVEVMERLNTLRKREVAGEFARFLVLPPVVLRAPVATPKRLEGTAGDLQLWVHFVPSFNNEERERPHVFELAATLINRGKKNVCEVVCALHAYFVPTMIRGLNLNGEEGLFDVMDAHSQYLADVYKTFTRDFLESIDPGSLEGLGFSGYSICVPTIYVRDAFRHKRVSELFLQSLYDTLNRPEQFEVGNRRERELVPELDEPLDSYEELEAMDGFVDEQIKLLKFNPIAVFVIAIEGTRPDEVQTAQPPLMFSKAKVRPPQRLDEIVERRRKKLTKYFQQISKAARGFYVHAYNPWDYQ